MDLYQVHKSKRAKLLRTRTVRAVVVVTCMVGVVLASRVFNGLFVLLTVVAAAIVADMADPLERQQFKLKRLEEAFSRGGMPAEEIREVLRRFCPSNALLFLTGSLTVTAFGFTELFWGNGPRSSSTFALFLGLFLGIGASRRVLEWRLWSGKWRLSDYI